MGTWRAERHETFHPYDDRWRIIDVDVDVRWSKYNTSARVPYIALVTGREVAAEICDAHNNRAEVERLLRRCERHISETLVLGYVPSEQGRELQADILATIGGEEA